MASILGIFVDFGVDVEKKAKLKVKNKYFKQSNGECAWSSKSENKQPIRIKAIRGSLCV